MYPGAMPVGPYPDFDSCLADGNSEAYCAALERITNAEASEQDWRLIMEAEVEPSLEEDPVEIEDPEMIEDGEMSAAQLADLDGDGIDDETGEPIEPEAEPMIEPNGQMEGEEFHALLVVEGAWTGDGRYIEEGALSWRSLPLPLMATDRTTEGHMDAVLIGRITRIERDGREIHAWGSFVRSDDAEIMRLQDFIRSGDLRGISVDLDSMEYEIVISPDVSEDSDDILEDEMNGDARMIITAARIMGATVVPFPAFEEAFIESLPALVASLARQPRITGYVQSFQSLDDLDLTAPLGARQEAERGLAWREEFGRGGTAVGVARARDLKNGKRLSPQTVNRMASYFARHEIDKEASGWRPGEDGYPSAGRIAWALWGGDPGWAWARKMQRSMAARAERGSIISSVSIEAPLHPPAAWFSDPRLGQPTPLTISDDGRVYGHLAVWGQCHVAYSDSCVTPPRSAARYANFLTGELMAEDGSRIPVGQITMDTGHASMQAGSERALAHYDNTGTAIADVCAGEDRHGIWLAGSLRPGLSPERVRAVMAADVSGDWRRIGSALELIAVLSVNVPGFPKSRVRIGESNGIVASMVASLGSSRPHLTTQVASSSSSAAERIARSIGRGRADRRAELAQRVHEFG